VSDTVAAPIFTAATANGRKDYGLFDLLAAAKMIFRSRAAQTTILAAGSAIALITATAGDRAHGEGNLDASYTISFARIPVGEITATAVFGQSEYMISARARAGGV
jgi:hypothetical protein